MGDDDQWRADGSFRGLSGGSGGKGGGGKKGSAPSFNRVIPKFLQKYHQGPVGPAINAKFQSAPQPPGEDDDGDDGELDEVQKAAMEEYVQKATAKKEARAAAADAKPIEAGEEQPTAIEKSTKHKRQRVAELGQQSSNSLDKSAKKRKKKSDIGSKTLSNKKLLSFSMDDEAI